MAIGPGSRELTHGGVLAGALTEAMLANEANTAADTQPMYAMTDDNASPLANRGRSHHTNEQRN